MSKTDHHEPSASGIPANSQIAKAYIGCRTWAYGPVSITCWPASTRTLDAGPTVFLDDPEDSKERKYDDRITDERDYG